MIIDDAKINLWLQDTGLKNVFAMHKKLIKLCHTILFL